MNPEPEYIDYLRDILDAIKKVERFTKGMEFKEFAEDDKTAFAVIRAFEIIGEAARNIPELVKTRYPAVAWREIAGTRNKLIHEYSGANLAVYGVRSRTIYPS